MTEPRITVIIPILNEAEELPTLLSSLRALDEDTVVLFVDGGSQTIVQRLCARPATRCSRAPRGALAR